MLTPNSAFTKSAQPGLLPGNSHALGLEIHTGIAGTGVVALIEGAKPGPVILVRADMDALPITEETGAAYASQNPGVMHACGHDGHTAILLTVARMLHAHRHELAGTVKFMFQPAEEGMGGAEKMIEERRSRKSQSGSWRLACTSGMRNPLAGLASPMVRPWPEQKSSRSK